MIKRAKVINMKEFEFTLKFKLPDTNSDPEAYLDALYDAGCDDALIGIGKKGHIALDFDREGEDSIEAMKSAIEDVYKAIPDAIFESASPDVVNLSDIADSIGVKRQYLQKIYKEYFDSFPEPLYSGKQISLWHMHSVMHFFIEHKISKKKAEVIEECYQLGLISYYLNKMKDMNENPYFVLNKTIDTNILNKEEIINKATLRFKQKPHVDLDNTFYQKIQENIVPLIA